MRSFWFGNCWWRFKERERGRIWRTSSLRKGKKARWFSQTAIIVKCEIVELLKIKRPIKDMLENNFAYFHPPWNWSQHCSANQCLSEFVFLWVEMEVIVFSILKPCCYPQFRSSGRQSLAWNIVVPDEHWWWVKFCFSYIFSDFGTGSGLGTLSAYTTYLCSSSPFNATTALFRLRLERESLFLLFLQLLFVVRVCWFWNNLTFWSFTWHQLIRTNTQHTHCWRPHQGSSSSKAIYISVHTLLNLIQNVYPHQNLTMIFSHSCAALI